MRVHHPLVWMVNVYAYVLNHGKLYRNYVNQLMLVRLKERRSSRPSNVITGEHCTAKTHTRTGERASRSWAGALEPVRRFAAGDGAQHIETTPEIAVVAGCYVIWWRAKTMCASFTLRITSGLPSSNPINSPTGDDLWLRIQRTSYLFSSLFQYWTQ